MRHSFMKLDNEENNIGTVKWWINRCTEILRKDEIAKFEKMKNELDDLK